MRAWRPGLDLFLPQVSINGASRESLVEQQRDVLNALDAVIRTMSAATPHGRDYQYRPDELHPARDAWFERINVVKDLAREIQNHALAIQGGD